MIPMSRIALLVSAMIAASGFSAEERKPAGRPNILIILADDLAAWHLGCYGNTEIKTPHLDRLAREGVLLRNAFCVTPICSPSRATLFSGRVPRQHGIHDFLGGNYDPAKNPNHRRDGQPEPNPPQGQKAIPDSFKDEVMISDLLAAARYECGYVGKWHMGNDLQPQHNYRYWRAGLSSGKFTDAEVSVDGKRVTEKGYSTEIFTRLATDFIVQKHSQPWFLAISYQNPHLPYSGQPQKYYDLYKNAKFETFGIEPKAPNALREAPFMDDPIKHLRQAAASTTALDDQIPVLLDALETSGQRGNTLVLFTGDNGFLYGRHGVWSKGWATNPINMYEESIRVPMIISYPKLQGGRELTQFVSFVDVLPTLCDVAGVRAPVRDRNLSGRSFWSVLQGKRTRWENIAFFNFRYCDAVRDERYKLVLRQGNGPDELFDLQADPRERENRITDPLLGKVQRRLQARLDTWKARYQRESLDRGQGNEAQGGSANYTFASEETCYSFAHAPVAQWIRASDYESEGRGFKSLRARQFCELPR